MADYYPLLAKAAAALPDPSPANRQAMYERARKALLGQLRAVDPPVAQEDIDAESLELDAAIARVEADFAPAPVAAEPAPPPPEPSAEALSEPPLAADAADMVAQGDDLLVQDSAQSLKVKLREPQRPLAPAPPPSRENSRRLWIVGAALAVVVAGVAGLAYLLKGSPDDLARLKPVPAPTADQGSGKVTERVGGSADPKSPISPAPKTTTSANPPAANPSAASTSGAATTTQSQVNQPPIPVAQRAALLVEAPDTESKVRTFIGTVVWRLDNVPAAAGQPLGTSVHADVEIPEAKVRASVDIRKNTDPALPAADTFEIRFNLMPGAALPGIKQISTPQMRREETPNGEILAGVPVKITDTYFFIGLAQGDLAQRNADLMRNRGWFDFPIQLTDDRVAKLTIEKGATGDRMIADALTSWDQ